MLTFFHLSNNLARFHARTCLRSVCVSSTRRGQSSRATAYSRVKSSYTDTRPSQLRQCHVTRAHRPFASTYRVALARATDQLLVLAYVLPVALQLLVLISERILNSLTKFEGPSMQTRRAMQDLVPDRLPRLKGLSHSLQPSSSNFSYAIRTCSALITRTLAHALFRVRSSSSGLGPDRQ